MIYRLELCPSDIQGSSGCQLKIDNYYKSKFFKIIERCTKLKIDIRYSCFGKMRCSRLHDKVMKIFHSAFNTREFFMNLTLDWI